MIQCIRSYMDDAIMSRELHDWIHMITSDSQDRTIRYVAHEMWGFYDDLKDHPIVVLKEEWDYLNRLLLLLESDYELNEEKLCYTWHWSQALAAMAFVGFVFAAWRTGISPAFFFAWLVCGAVVCTVAWVNSRQDARLNPLRKRALDPFPSIASLLAVRRSVPGFTRNRWQEWLSQREIRSKVSTAILYMNGTLAVLLLSPLILLWQMTPRKRSSISITLPEHASQPA